MKINFSIVKKYPLELFLIVTLFIIMVPFLILAITFMLISSIFYFFIEKTFLKIDENIEKKE
mgnify:CR=1 FL=1